MTTFHQAGLDGMDSEIPVNAQANKLMRLAFGFGVLLALIMLTLLLTPWGLPQKVTASMRSQGQTPAPESILAQASVLPEIYIGSIPCPAPRVLGPPEKDDMAGRVLETDALLRQQLLEFKIAIQSKEHP